jgi:hypothetical protein
MREQGARRFEIGLQAQGGFELDNRFGGCVRGF